MEAIVLRMINESALRLGLGANDAVVNEANAVGLEALASGYDVDNAFEFARSVLIRATQPSATFTAA